MPRADRVPFLPSRPLVAVPVTLNASEDVLLIADSGAARTLISRRVAALLGLDLTRPLRLQPLAGVGQTPPAPVVRLDWVQVGASIVRGLEAFVYDLPFFIRADGLLGLEVVS